MAGARMKSMADTGAWPGNGSTAAGSSPWSEAGSERSSSRISSIWARASIMSAVCWSSCARRRTSSASISTPRFMASVLKASTTSSRSASTRICNANMYSRNVTRASPTRCDKAKRRSAPVQSVPLTSQCRYRQLVGHQCRTGPASSPCPSERGAQEQQTWAAEEAGRVRAPQVLSALDAMRLKAVVRHAGAPGRTVSRPVLLDCSQLEPLGNQSHGAHAGHCDDCVLAATLRSA